MRSLSHGLTACAASVVLVSCTPDDHGGVNGALALQDADREIAAVLYAGTRRTPVGFAADPVPPSFTQVTTYHVKSSQLAVPAASVHEVCTDDASTALAWSDEVAVQSASQLDLVATQTTPRYFELGRVPRGEPDRYVRMRVLRCAYLDRTGVELSLANGYAGTLNARPLDADALRALAEYLWHFTVYNNAGHAVLASEPRGANLTHVLTIASLERTALGTCDRVTLREWAHQAAPGTGVLTSSVAVVREFGVRQTAGVPASC